MPDMVVYVTNTSISPINEAEFQVLDPVTAVWSPVSGNLIEDGVYVLTLEDDQDLTTCVPGVYECDSRSVESWPSTYPFSYSAPTDYDAMLIVLENVDIDAEAEIDGQEEPDKSHLAPRYCSCGC